MPMRSFSVNIEFSDFTFSVSTKGKRLYRSRCYLAVLRQPLEELMCLRISLPLSYAKLRWRLFRNTRVRHRKATAIRAMMPIALFGLIGLRALLSWALKDDPDAPEELKPSTLSGVRHSEV